VSSDASGVVGHLFRHEAGRMLSALTRVLGIHNLDLAEDAVQDTLCRALETWKMGRVPDDPQGWLIRAARNRAVDLIRRERTARRFAPDVTQLLETEWTLERTVDSLFMEHELRDDQLRLMFSCCPPELSSEAQVTVILKLLCGFGVEEIAQAFLTSVAAIEKRLARAKAILAAQGQLFEVTGGDALRARLDAVHAALYLLFNEGYHASRGPDAVRDDLCQESLRLTSLLAEHPATAVPSTHALFALMCLHAARLPARVDGDGRLLIMAEQDRSRWDAGLLARGSEALGRAADENPAVAASSPYQIEAAIAALHAFAPSYVDTDWIRIEALYDKLFVLRPTPVVALARAIARGEAHGPVEGLRALGDIVDRARLESQPFVHAARAQWLRRLDHIDEARVALNLARQVARTDAERTFIDHQLALCRRAPTA
jgi:RNA polymerase sigma factor (sigma-70 family)